jgi:hypothetical protein
MSNQFGTGRQTFEFTVNLSRKLRHAVVLEEERVSVFRAVKTDECLK